MSASDLRATMVLHVERPGGADNTPGPTPKESASMQAQPTAQDDGPVVYVIQGEHGGPVKIGYCARRSGVAQRLTGIQTGNPYPLVVRNIIPAPEGVEAERALHRECAPWRLAGEWFLPVRSVCEALGIPAHRNDPETLALEPLIWSAFNAGLAHGRRVAERDNREMMTEFLKRALPWLFDLRDAQDLDICSAEVALRSVLDRGDRGAVAHLTAFGATHRPCDLVGKRRSGTGEDAGEESQRAVA